MFTLFIDMKNCFDSEVATQVYGYKELHDVVCPASSPEEAAEIFKNVVHAKLFDRIICFSVGH